MECADVPTTEKLWYRWQSMTEELSVHCAMPALSAHEMFTIISNTKVSGM